MPNARKIQRMIQSLFSIFVLTGTLMFSFRTFNTSTAQAQGLSAASAQAGTNPVQVSGRLGVVWADADPRENRPPQIYLFDENGNAYLLEIPEQVRAQMGEISALKDRPVQISGTLHTHDVEILSDGTLPGPDTIEVSSVDFQFSTASASASVTGSKPWIIVLCKFKDVSAEPEPVSYFQGLFGNSFGQINDYWKTVSYGTINTNGSAVVTHWYTLPNNRSYYVSGSSANLQRLANDCTAAANADVYYPSFFGINMMFNDDLDGAAWGGGWYLSLDGASQYFPLTWMPPWGYENQNTMAHEMGHGFGLPHSSGAYGQTYDSNWDVMSGDWNCFQYTSTGCLATDTISYHKYMLGWIPLSREYDSVAGTSRSLVIERLNAIPSNPDAYLMARVLIPGTSRFYTVEVRDNITSMSNSYTPFDEYEDDLPSNDFSKSSQPNAPVVLIHEVNPARDNEAQVVDQTLNNDPNDEGAMWRPGETFVDAAYNISISVLSTSGTGYLVRIQNGTMLNDNIATPVTISTTPFSFDEDTRATTNDANDPLISCGGNIQGHGTVWYKFKPATYGIVSLDTADSSFDTLLAVWNGTPGALTSVACDDDSDGSGLSSLSFEADLNTTYYIEAAGKTGTGDLSLHLDMIACYLPTLKVSPSGTGMAIPMTSPNCGSSYYQNGTSITYAAVPNGGYTFKSWSGSASSVNNPLTLTLNSNQTLTANFVTTSSTSVLVSPSNSALTTDYTPALTWKQVSMSSGSIFDHYQLQLGSDSGFGTTLYDQSINNIAMPSFTPSSDLTPNSLYYWRVRVYNTVGNYSNWSAVWSFRTALTSPIVVTPTAGHHEITLLPSFDWEDVSGATSYTIQISKSPAFVSSKKKKLNTIIHSATTVASEYTPVANLPVGSLLYWRVVANGPNGPSEWSEVRSFTTANPPGAPVLTFPGNNALLSDYAPALTWSQAIVPLGTTFDHYQLQLDGDASFASPLVDTSISSLTNAQYQVTPALPDNATFYWRVYAFNTQGESNLSLTYSFRTALTQPIVVAPTDGHHEITLLPSFDWEDVSGATSYTIQIANNPNFASSKKKKKKSKLTVLSATTISSEYTPATNLAVNTLYYWRVAANNTTNGPSLWSEVRSFTTANPPSASILTYPGDNALITDYAPLLTWKAAVVPTGTTFDHYQLQLDDDPDFTSPLVDTSIPSSTNTQHQVSPALPDNATFHWRVYVFNTQGESNLSLTYSFHTSMLPVVLTTPSEGTTVGALTPVFDWQDVNGATSYTIQIATAPSFASSKKKSKNKLILSTPVVDF